MQLADLQLEMRQAVVAGAPARIVPLLIGGQDPSKRLEIHRRQYESSLVTALLGKFPATVWLVGSQFVTEAARHYVHECPPRRPCIAEYGERFADFLSASPAAARVPYLREFMELEWHLGYVSIAIEQPAIPLDKFSMISAEALPETVLSLQPGLRHLHASWPIDVLMKLYLTETAPDFLEFVPEEVWIEVNGARGEFQINRLTRGEFTFRRFILEGQSIGEATEAAVHAETDFDPGVALASLMAEGLIIAIKYNQE